MNILSTLLWTPAFGALLLAFISYKNIRLIRSIAYLSTIFAFLLSCKLLLDFDSSNVDLQFFEYQPLNPKMGSSYALGVDGLFAYGCAGNITHLYFFDCFIHHKRACERLSHLFIDA